MEWPPRYPSDYVPNDESEYWAQDLETMPPDQRDTIILEKMRLQVRYAYNHSGFYQEFYRDVDVDPTNISSFQEFFKWTPSSGQR